MLLNRQEELGSIIPYQSSLSLLEKGKIGSLIPAEKEEVMQIVTSWMEQGIEQGRQEAIVKEKDLIVRQIKRKVGNIDMELENRVKSLNIEVIEVLAEAIFDLDTVEDLQNWLDKHD